MALLCKKLIGTISRGNFQRKIRRINSRYSRNIPEPKILLKTPSFKSNLRNKRLSKINANPLLVKESPLNYATCSGANQDKGGRHLYHQDVENAMNQQILTEFNASYAYLSMSAFFGRSDIALPGCQGFFYDMYMEEIEHGIVFMNYQLMRGGYVNLLTIEAPEREWGDIQKAFEAALQMEKTVKEKITCVLQEAEKHCDHQLVDFLTSQYLKEQNESIQKMSRLLTRAKKMIKDPNGEFLFDRQLFLNYVKDKNLMFSANLPDVEDKTYK